VLITENPLETAVQDKPFFCEERIGATGAQKSARDLSCCGPLAGKLLCAPPRPQRFHIRGVPLQPRQQPLQASPTAMTKTQLGQPALTPSHQGESPSLCHVSNSVAHRACSGDVYVEFDRKICGVYMKNVMLFNPTGCTHTVLDVSLVAYYKVAGP